MSAIDSSPSTPDEPDLQALLSDVLPLQNLLAPTETDYLLLDNAVDVLTKDCMKRRGFDYRPYPPRPKRNLLDLRTRYGLLTAADAATSGYRTTIPSGDPAEYLAAVDKIDREREAAGESYLTTLYGPNGDGGCRGDASMQSMSPAEWWGSRDAILGGRQSPGSSSAVTTSSVSRV